LRKEASYGSIMGSFESNPFDCQFKISPLNSVTKKDSSETRVILDLSFSPGCSVNDNISKDIYLGEKIEGTYPNIDDLVGILTNKGRGSFMFKKDLKRAYRQFPICPGDLHLVDFNWNGYLFADRVLPMGLRSSAQICQRITTSITFMYFKLGYMMVNYLDDFGRAETKEKGWKAYETLGELLMFCSLEESVDKAVTPTTKMTFLGVSFD
jgi:hypothetical protein